MSSLNSILLIEAKVNSATELYLNNQQVLLEEKLEFWIKKYETDTKVVAIISTTNHLQFFK